MLVTIKPDVTIHKFDSTDATFSYVIGYNDRHWKVNEIVYLIFGYISNGSSIESIPEKLESENNIVISEEKLQFIINEVFVKNGLLVDTEEQTKKRKDKGMWLRITVIPQKVVEKFSFLKVMFVKYIFILCGVLTALFFIYFNFYYINNSSMDELYHANFKEWIMVLLFIMISTVIHEFGHSSALMACGERPGRIGAGFYMIMPVFFADVHNSWNLSRKQRVVVDLGGVYFQGVFLIMCWAVNEIALHMSAISYFIAFSCIQIVGNFNPFLKMDGYWMLSDSLGISNLYDTIWNITLGRIFRRKSCHQIPVKITVILYVYIIFILVFIARYIKNYLYLVSASLKKIISDLSFLANGGINVRDIKVTSIVNYISENFTAWLVCIFSVILIYRLINKLIKPIIHKS